MRTERLNKKKEVLFEGRSKGYVIAKPKRINKCWDIKMVLWKIFKRQLTYEI